MKESNVRHLDVSPPIHTQQVTVSRQALTCSCMLSVHLHDTATSLSVPGSRGHRASVINDVRPTGYVPEVKPVDKKSKVRRLGLCAGPFCPPRSVSDEAEYADSFVRCRRRRTHVPLRFSHWTCGRADEKGFPSGRERRQLQARRLGEG